VYVENAFGDGETEMLGSLMTVHLKGVPGGNWVCHS